MLAAMAPADEEGRDGTINDDELQAPLGTAREPTPWDDRTIDRDELRAPLETGVREPTPWFDRIEPGANDPRTWHHRAIGGGEQRARTEPGETGDDWSRGSRETDGQRATGDDWSRGSTENSYIFLCALEVAIQCLDIMRDALRYIKRRIRHERVVQSPVCERVVQSPV